MPNTASAKKRHRQSLVRRTRNRAARATLRTLVRQVRDAASAGNVEEGEARFRVAAKKLDQAASRKVIHANAAARVKSRLSAALKAAKPKTPA
ncbi:MAG TPA: 30S ribosomal protein S20 [Pirellulales bacterium]|nr:30S ribosomal protein S20 [Pirellulales bacterium]